MLIKIVTSMSLAILGQESFQQAQKLTSDSESQYNQAFIDASIDTLRIILIALTIGRVLLLLCALRDQRLARCFFYYEAMIEMLGHFIPQKVYTDGGTGE